MVWLLFALLQQLPGKKPVDLTTFLADPRNYAPNYFDTSPVPAEERIGAELKSFLEISSPTSGPDFSSADRTVNVWRRNGAYVVDLDNRMPGSFDDSPSELLLFDRNGRFVNREIVWLGTNGGSDGTKKVTVSGISDLILRTEVVDRWGRRNFQYTGLVGDRPAIIRSEDESGRVRVNSFEYGGTPVGPPFPEYSKRGLSKALQSTKLVEVLEALVWLSGKHWSPSASFGGFAHEPIPSTLRFWSLLSASAVRQKLVLLTKSDCPWVAEYARAALKTPIELPPNRPQQHLTDRLLVEDKIVGSGSEWQSRNVVLRKGDRGIFDVTSALPDGTVVQKTNSRTEPVLIEIDHSDEPEGFRKGVIGMRSGGVRRLTVPAKLAFGTVGATDVPANSDLIYEVRLIRVERDLFGSEPVRSRDLKVGTGTSVALNQPVSYRFKSWLSNGKSIDGSDEWHIVEHEVVTSRGMGAAIIGMRVGGARRAFVKDSRLPPRTNGPYDGRIVEIELLSVEPPPIRER